MFTFVQLLTLNQSGLVANFCKRKKRLAMTWQYVGGQYCMLYLFMCRQNVVATLNVFLLLLFSLSLWALCSFSQKGLP